jgi:hypothetical protein
MTDAKYAGDANGPNAFYLTWDAVADAVSYNIYARESSDGIFGYIGAATGNAFDDLTIAPDYVRTPPENRTPFAGANNKPATGTYHQQRVVAAGTNNQPQTLFATRTGLFHNLSVSHIPQDDDAFTRTLASRQVNRIRHLISLEDLLAFTTSTVWLIAGSELKALTPSSFEATPKVEYGVGQLPPIVTGPTVLFVQDPGARVRDLVSSNVGYTGTDRSVLSQHLFDGYSIVDWCYAPSPDSVVWAVRSDGALLSFTYVLEQEVWAWAHHDSHADEFLGAASIPMVCGITGATFDAVYVTTKRRINGVVQRFMERFRSRFFTDVRDAFFVDCGLSLDDPIVITAATQADPVEITTATSHGFSNGDPVDIADIVGMTEINNHRYIARNVTATTFTLEDEYAATDIDGTGFVAYISGGTARKAFATMSGLDHLEGEEVVGLANGDVFGATVTSGSVTLPKSASRVHVGLPIVADLETLGHPHHGFEHLVTEVTLVVYQSRGGFVGPDVAHLREAKWRTSEGYNESTQLRTGEINIVITQSWNREGRVFVRQVDPLPLTVSAIISRLRESDRV